MCEEVVTTCILGVEQRADGGRLRHSADDETLKPSDPHLWHTRVSITACNYSLHSRLDVTILYLLRAFIFSS